MFHTGGYVLFDKNSDRCRRLKKDERAKISELIYFAISKLFFQHKICVVNGNNYVLIVYIIIDFHI